MYISRQERRRRRLVDWPAPTLIASRGLRQARRARRLVRWLLAREGFSAPDISVASLEHLHFEEKISLKRCGGDPRLERGKRRNVALAAVALDGRLLVPGEVFSFWRTVGRPSRDRGYALGAEVRAGCVVPTTGGGLCLIANTLFRAAAELGWTIHERWGHTAAVGDDIELDATIAWPDVDLRFEAPTPGLLEVRVAGDELLIRVHGNEPAPPRWSVERSVFAGDVLASDIIRIAPSGARELLGQDRKRRHPAPTTRPNCFDCGELSCHGRPRDLR